MKPSVLVASAVVVSALLGCGLLGKPTIRSLTVTPASLPYGGGKVILTWDVADAGSLSLDQGVGDVSGLTSKEVEVQTTTVFTLTATNGNGTSQSQVTVNVETVTAVSGRVVGADGQPVPGAVVVIGSLAPASTAADGSFSIPNVVPPYDATVALGNPRLAVVYKGLRRKDPTLLMRWGLGTPNQADLTGRVSGGVGFPADSSTVTRVAFSSPEAPKWTPQVSALTGNFFGAGTTPYVTWYGPTNTTGTIHALQYLVGGQGLPMSYTGYGKREGVTLTAGQVTGSLLVTLGSVGSALLSGSVSSVPSGYTLAAKSVHLVFGRNELQIIRDTFTSPDFSYLVPTGVAPLSLLAQANGPGGAWAVRRRSGLSATSGLSLDVPAAPQLNLPVDSAAGVTTQTPFVWSAFAEGLYEVTFTPQTSSAPSIKLVTSATSATIPDLASLGLPLPKGASYTWSVYAYGPFASIDAATGPEGLRDSPGREGTFGSSGARTFTTAP